MYTEELNWPNGLTVRPGGAGPSTARVQEMCCLRMFPTPVDGAWGPGTTMALKNVLKAIPVYQPPVEVAVDDHVWLELSRPIRNALLPGRPLRSVSKADALIELAHLHLAQRPRRVGNNGGPWVRTYTQGSSVTWSCGFVCTIIQQMESLLGGQTTMPFTLSCSSFATAALNRGFLLVEDETPIPGDIMLIPDSDPGYYRHIGIVVEVSPENDAILCIEADTNQDSSAEGFELSGRSRKIAGKRFVRLAR